MTMIRYLILSSAVILLQASAASACPLCHTETGEKVRAGIFSEEFGQNVLLTLFPFPVLAGLVALIHFGFPNPNPSRPDRACDLISTARNEGTR